MPLKDQLMLEPHLTRDHSSIHEHPVAVRKGTDEVVPSHFMKKKGL
jgi:hypothetical protein